MPMYDFSETAHVEPLQPEPGYNDFPRERGVNVLENERDAPKGLDPETFLVAMSIWDDATVHRAH